ncbi:MAG: TlpA family protein disulfide reductase [Gammaproteobacteria bacterium]|nr:TlpA family protein disulfide reductase [Gammaproteobacteria bacterium]
MNRYFSALMFLIALPLGAQALDMPLTAVDRSQTNLELYEGKWVVVNYWATWCPPCIVEMPELQSFHDEHANRDALVIGINYELISEQRLQEFLEDYFISYPNFVSRPGQQSELGLIPGLPTTFLVSPGGKVVARQVGPVTRDMIEQFIQNWQPE